MRHGILDIRPAVSSLGSSVARAQSLRTSAARQRDRLTFALTTILYRDGSLEWLGGGPFYDAYQVAGPYSVVLGAILYPSSDPRPAGAVAPVLLAALLVADLARHHRRRRRHASTACDRLAWALRSASGIRLLACAVLLGIPFVAAVALATLSAWPAVCVFLKPTTPRFALIGARRRSWWIALSGLGLVSLLVLSMWPDYVRVIQDAQSSDGILDSLNELPMAAITAIAWVGSTVRPMRAAVRQLVRSVHRPALRSGCASNRFRIRCYSRIDVPFRADRRTPVSAGRR